jgi:hypothetical protein
MIVLNIKNFLFRVEIKRVLSFLYLNHPSYADMLGRKLSCEIGKVLKLT